MKHTNSTRREQKYGSPIMEIVSVTADTSFAVSMSMGTTATHDAYTIDEEFNW